MLSSSLSVALYGESLMLACLEATMSGRPGMAVWRPCATMPPSRTPDLLVVDRDLRDTLAVTSLRRRFPDAPLVALDPHDADTAMLLALGPEQLLRAVALAAIADEDMLG
ncbi:MAG: hypothetical protein RLZZ387_592 [Chloroflexota bacterium]|jgi:hypothetical protein